MKRSNHLYDYYLKPLLAYLEREGNISTWMKSQIRTIHSRKADANNAKSPRSFCFVIIGEHAIHCADAIKNLPDKFIVGILLHEIAHMIIEEDGGDPELGVDEWVLENVPDSGYEYKNVTYTDPDDRRRAAKNLECVSEEFLHEIGIWKSDDR